MKLTENAKIVYDYVSANDGKEMTAADIADGTGLGVKSVNAIVSFSFQAKGLMERTPAEATLSDGTTKVVKLISLTDEGRNLDIEE
jgi:DNA-binding MarR family transcriptional regulator